MCMSKILKNILGLVFVFFFVFLGVFALSNTASASSCTITTTLRQGSIGNEVKCLQEKLNQSVNLNLSLDGNFGPKTKEAVVAWQKLKGLTPDGIFGPISRLALADNITNLNNFPLGCTSVSGFSVITGASCANVSTPPTGCTSTSGFSVTTGVSCANTNVAVLPAGCMPNALFSTMTGLSCTTGLPAYTVPKVIGSGGSSGSSIRVINNSTVSGVTIPLQGEAPVSTLAGNTQYTATISWVGSPAVFLASTSYTATITITPKDGYTLTGIPADFFTVAGAVATNSADSGVITAVFPSTPLLQLTISNPTLTTSKLYDGDTTAVVLAGALSGIIGSEDVTVTAVANYDTKGVGTDKTITVVYTLGGADAGNYIKPADYTVSTGEITQISLTIANPTLTNSKEYDRTTTAVVTAGALSGVVGGDDVSVSAVATYDSPAVNTGKTITVVYTLSGADAGNYIKPVDRIVYSGVITQKQLTISAPTPTTTKLYDRNTTAVITPGTLSGIVGAEDVSINTAVASYDNENVGTGKTITVVYTITGAEALNYIKPVNYTSSSGTITAILLTISNPALTTSKPYDGDNTAIVTAGSLSGILGGDTVTVDAVATYDTSVVGTGKTITVVYTLGGADAENYIKPINYTTATGAITTATITIAPIAGITAPVNGATPTATIADTDEYTATISWSDSPVTFGSAVVYTATITITPKASYTLTGISENFFTVAGATATNSINSGVVSAVFPATMTTIPAGAIAGVTVPVISATPVTTVTQTAGYTGTVTWSGNPVTFAGATIYTATITLSPKAGYTLTGITANQFTVAGSTSATNSINSGVITAVFPQTYTTPDYAAPSAVVLATGSTNGVTGVITNVSIPAPNATNTTGVIRGWEVTTAETIKFTVTDSAGVSTITIDGNPYTSGTDYVILSTSSLSIVVTTTQSGKIDGVRTFTIPVFALGTSIGDPLGGGKIAYFLTPSDPGYDANVSHGLIASTADLGTIRWFNGSNIVTGVTGTALGTGLGNTDAIITAQGAVATSYAAGLARAHAGGGYTDWFLPSKDELSKLYTNRVLIGGFSTSSYWSSSEVDASLAWVQYFFNGLQTSATKSTTYVVRAVRAF